MDFDDDFEDYLDAEYDDYAEYVDDDFFDDYEYDSDLRNEY